MGIFVLAFILIDGCEGLVSFCMLSSACRIFGFMMDYANAYDGGRKAGWPSRYVVYRIKGDLEYNM